MIFERLKKLLRYAEKLLMVVPFLLLYVYFMNEVRNRRCATQALCDYYFQVQLLDDVLKFGIWLVCFFLCRRFFSSENVLMSFLVTVVEVTLFSFLFILIVFI